MQSYPRHMLPTDPPHCHCPAKETESVYVFSAARITTTDRSGTGKMTIDVLPDDTLLEIFVFYRGDNEYFTTKMWKTLVHVCRKWRSVIFASPRRLHLLLVCDARTPVTRLLDIWPVWPITIHYSPKDGEGKENVIAALECRDRISWIDFNELTSQVSEKFVAVMEEPLPALTGLHLQSNDVMGPVISDAFLAGSAPSLRYCFLEGIAFPALHGFVVSAIHLTKLWLQRIPHAGYISPEMMVTCLAVLPNLEELSIGFQYPRAPQINSPPPTRTVLPTVTYFAFKGVSEYLEDLVARINTPKLHNLNIWFFMDNIFTIPQLYNFIYRTERLKLRKRASMELHPWSARIAIGSPPRLHLGFKCDRLDWRVSSMAQLCEQLSPFLSQVECLEINGDPDIQAELQDDMESTQWLELFHPFRTVQDLYVSKKLGLLVALGLQGLTGEGAAVVLPELRNLSFGGLKPYTPVQEAIGPFVSARKLSNRPVFIARWEQDPYWDAEDDTS